MRAKSPSTLRSFALSDQPVVRLLRLLRFAGALERGLAWLLGWAPRVSLRVPEPMAVGRPVATFPCAWVVYRWLEGGEYSDAVVADEPLVARVLARFVGELRGFEGIGGPRAGRAPILELDAATRDAICAADGAFDAGAALACWERALPAPAWDGAPVWIHGDLMRPNLLVRNGCLDAVMDFGGVGVGDPAMDLVAAWSVFGPVGRVAFRIALEREAMLDQGAWERARGSALHQAVLIIPYYADSNPRFAAEVGRIVSEVLWDDAC
jgi:aminoglycoside phosphotransferase (APT) family kinase protein